MIEKWIGIKDYENLYEVSNLGRVKALYKEITYKDGRVRKYEEKILKPRIDPKGYYFISLYGHKIMQVRVHRLVAEAFIPNPSNKLCVNHKDSNRLNNNLSNLEWVTYSENTIHGIKYGNINTPGKKITKEVVEEIRDYYKENKISQKNLGAMYGLSQAQICRIVTKQNWI